MADLLILRSLRAAINVAIKGMMALLLNSLTSTMLSMQAVSNLSIRQRPIQRNIHQERSEIGHSRTEANNNSADEELLAGEVVELTVLLVCEAGVCRLVVVAAAGARGTDHSKGSTDLRRSLCKVIGTWWRSSTWLSC